MINPIYFYTEEKEKLVENAATLKKKSKQLSVFRFLVFLITGAFVYTTFGEYPTVFIGGFIGALLFSFLVVQQVSLQKKRKILDKKIAINSTEIAVLNGDFHQLNSGDRYIDSSHYYSNDIDLFGVGSFFQYLNRTATLAGEKYLASLLIQNKTSTIVNKQLVLKELAAKVHWRQHFSALASLVSVKESPTLITNWLANYTVVLYKHLPKVQLLFSVASLFLITAVFLGKIPFTILVIWFFIGVFITAAFVKKTSNLYTETNLLRGVFSQYHQLLNEIENETFSAAVLVEKQQIISSEAKKASAIFKEFSKILDAFDQRNNILISVVGNGLFLTEIYNACKVEKWIVTYKHVVKEWFSVVAYFDAYNSLANFTFNHPAFVFPEITSEKQILKATNLGHPLLNAAKRIDNNFSIDKEQFFIVTGSNMAGKSTFLRTISLSIVMANSGLPVCADSFKYTPIKLITSMRTTDSLTEDESYFYSELKRLKFIIDEIVTEDYFIILDEILKGTNSKDKAVGSKKFVEKLTKSKSTGIIATHDVSLCELEDEFLGIKNYYFDAEIINNELYFDYTLKNGICKNMNASFLLKKMEII